jgi:hypothetical protein
MSRSPNRIRSVQFGRWTHGLQPQRVKGSECAQSPLYTQWPRLIRLVPGDRGRQYKNTKPRRNLDIQSQARVVNGIAALVTTPLRSLVTRAPSVHASPSARHSPVTGLAVVLRCRGIRAHIPDHRGPQAPLDAAPPLAREFEARVAVTGKTWGLGGQLTFSEWSYPAFNLAWKSPTTTRISSNVGTSP